ncbi:MAG: VOC family protein [Ginsengibacter sp.]
MAKQIFVNLPVKQLDKTKEFFSKLGFSFNPKFTNNDGACMIIGENIFAMLLVEEFFKSFTTKQIADTLKTTEVLLAIDAESREKVDKMIENAIAAGGKEHREKQDEGWMYSRGFEDVDGHIWEVLYMDEKAMPQQ